MNKLFLISILITFLSPIYAQEITMLYTPEDTASRIIVRDIVETTDDHIFAGYDIIGGGTTRSGIMLTNMDGEVIWSKKLEVSGADADCVFDVAKNAEGNFYLLGYGKGGALNVSYLMEINPDGEVLWTKKYDLGWGGGIPLYRINQLEVLPSGDLHMMLSSMYMVINLRTNASGEILWGKKIIPEDDGGLGKNPGFESIAAEDGGSYCASKTEDELLLLRYDIDGELLWNKHYQLGGYTHAKSLITAPNGNLLIAGYIQIIGEGIIAPHVMEINADDGSIVWIKIFDGFVSAFASRTHLSVIDGRIYMDFTVESELSEQYIVELSETGQVLNAMKSKTAVSDYNRLKLINDQAYFFGSKEVAHEFQGVINRTENIFTESCFLGPIAAPATSDFEDYSELIVGLVESEYTTIEDGEALVIDFELSTSDPCAASLSVQENEDNYLKLYPNPATTNLNVRINANLVNSQYKIVDLSGRSLIQGTIINTIENIELSGLESGQYILYLQSNGSLITERFTIL